MASLGKYLRTQEGNQIAFWCPGCDQAHAVRVAPGAEPWGFNGNAEKPTFTPSVLVTGRDFTVAGKQSYQEWMAGGCTSPAPKFEAADTRCHTFVTDGKIQFLGDCTHALAGQTVDLPEFP